MRRAPAPAPTTTTMRTPTTPTPSRSRRRRGALAASLIAVALGAPGWPAAGSSGPHVVAAGARPMAPNPAVTALAPPSPDLPGLPPVSLDLAAVPVDSSDLQRALRAYEEVDGALAAAQARRLEVDRGLATSRVEQQRRTAELAAARASAAAAQARLDVVDAAIADLSISLYVDGGSAARIDAALTDEQPAINDHDRQRVLASASLDVLLAEHQAYEARLEAAQARIAVATDALAAVATDRAALSEARPAATEAEAAAAPPVAEERVRYEGARVLATVDGVDFPLVALDAYHRAAGTISEEDPACAVRWWAVAGISRVEGRHGTYGGSRLDEQGDTTQRIIGIQLNGTNATRVVADTDGGEIDGDPAYDRAVGPMQFIPETWRRFAADGNDDGVQSPFNLYDATLAAARYLCRASTALDAEPGLRQAYFSYNQSEAYVTNVLGWARLYEARVELPGAPEPT